MEPFARWLDWSSDPIAERMSFSSFSHSVDNIWGHDIERPFQIVLRPGYRVPESLDRDDKDALWFHKEEVRDAPVVVWDGFCPTILFEVIRECFDYDGSNEFIAVRDVKARKWVKDTRDPDIMALRPRRMKGWGPRKIHNHITELLVWSGMFPTGNKTSQLYSEMLMEDASHFPESEDSYKRACYFLERGMQNVSAYDNHELILEQFEMGKIKLNRACCFGKPFVKGDERDLRDADCGLLDTSFHGMANSAPISKDDFEGVKPDSYYRYAVRAGRKFIQSLKPNPKGDLSSLSAGGARGEVSKGPDPNLKKDVDSNLNSGSKSNPF